MKIGFIIGNMSSSGGTERVLQMIANGLIERGYDISVISMHGKEESFFPLDGRIKRFRLQEEYPKSILANLGNVKRLYKIVKQEQFDILVDVDLILCFYSLPVKFLTKCKVISWEHFNYYYQFRKNNKIRRIAMRFAARFSDVVLVLSKEDFGYYEKNLKIRHRLEQIYNPNPYESPKETGAEKKETLIFAAGRLTKAKGFDYLIQSWAMLENKYPDWRVEIAGQGEDEDALKEMAAQYGLKNLSFIGKVNLIEEYYKRAAIFALPSRNEGFGMVLIEAMAYEVPAVSFSCQAGPSDIITSGKDGILVETGDFKGFADALESLMVHEEKRKEMGEMAAASLERFAPAVILNQWEALLKSME